MARHRNGDKFLTNLIESKNEGDDQQGNWSLSSRSTASYPKPLSSNKGHGKIACRGGLYNKQKKSNNLNLICLKKIFF